MSDKQSKDEVHLDGLFMGAIQQSPKGIDGFFLSLFSFLRRKTDFYSMEEEGMKLIQKNYADQQLIWKDDKKREAALLKKREDEKRELKKKQEEEAKLKQGESSATVEEVTDEQAEKIMEEEARKKAKANKEEAKDSDNEEMKEDGEDGEKKGPPKIKPNDGNGGSTEKYDWIQTLDEVTVWIKVPDLIKANQLDVKFTQTKLTCGVKGKPSIIDGEWFKKIKVDDSMWSLESDGDKRVLQMTLQKLEGQCWWESVMKGDMPIDCQKVEPENSKLSDLDLETRAAVEKMMYDQNQKMMGKPTIEEQGKRDKLKDFMAAHPEMDFSKCKFM